MRAFVILLAALIWAPVANSAPEPACDSDNHSALGEIGIGTPLGDYYLDDRGGPTVNGDWLYQESNGDPGLQRGGTDFLGHTDPCRDNPLWQADTLLLGVT